MLSNYERDDFRSTFTVSLNSSLFQKIVCKFENFDDYLRADYVIGHDVIGHPKVGTDNSRLGLYGHENRLVIHGHK